MTIKLYRSTDQDAPQIRGNASLIAMLDAVLVNGYGQVTVSGITRTGATATVTTATAHGLATGDVATIAGADQAAYNGEFVITRTSATVYTVAVTGTPTTPATGSMTSRRAPGGFSKPYAATNRGVYRSNDTSGLRHFYSFWDEGSTAGGFREGRFMGFVNMTDINTGSDPFPTVAQRSEGAYFMKSWTADTTARPWWVVTNGKTVYIVVEPSAGDTRVLMGFGDMIPTRPADTHASFVSGNTFANVTAASSYGLALYEGRAINGNFTALPLMYSPRNFTGAGASTPMCAMINLSGATTIGSSLLPYPHVPDNGFYMLPVLAAQGSAVIRARMPGYFESLHGSIFLNDTQVENVQALPGRKFEFFALRTGNSLWSGVLIDITGPWD